MVDYNLVSGDTYIALPGGGAVPASNIYGQDPSSGLYMAPSTDYASGYGGTTYQIGANTQWFPAYSGGSQDQQQQPTTSGGTGASAGNLLRQYGLDELLPYVEQISRGRLTWAELEAQLYDPTSKPGKVVDRVYPELRLLHEAGREPMSIAQIQSVREQYRRVFALHDAPAGFYDAPDDFTQLIVHGKSPDEVNADLSEWRLVADEAAADPGNATALAELHRLYGITPDSGAFLSYVIDPERGLDSIRKQVAAGTLGATSLKTGYGALSLQEAELLAARGVDRAAGMQGFSDLVHEQQLLQGLPGEIGQGISRDEQLGAEFTGDQAARDKIERTRGQRLAEFDSGGRIAEGRGGTTGLTSS